MKLKEFYKDYLLHVVTNKFATNLMMEELIKLESIINNFNLIYGIDLEIELKPVQPKPGKWYGRGILRDIVDIQEHINSKIKSS